MSRAFWAAALIGAVFAAIAAHLGAPTLGALASWASAVGITGTMDIQKRRNGK